MKACTSERSVGRHERVNAGIEAAPETKRRAKAPRTPGQRQAPRRPPRRRSAGDRRGVVAQPRPKRAAPADAAAFTQSQHDGRACTTEATVPLQQSAAAYRRRRTRARLRQDGSQGGRRERRGGEPLACSPRLMLTVRSVQAQTRPSLHRAALRSAALRHCAGAGQREGARGGVHASPHSRHALLRGGAPVRRPAYAAQHRSAQRAARAACTRGKRSARGRAASRLHA